jgi:hypothetical protein
MMGTSSALPELVRDPKNMARILGKSTVVFLSIHNEPAPYIVPLFFGYENARLYVHSSTAGTKIELLRADPRVGFTAVAAAKIVEGTTACDFTVRAASVAGNGTARFIEDEREKLHALDLIMRHYSVQRPGDSFHYRPASLLRTCVIAIDILSIIGKRFGDQIG